MPCKLWDEITYPFPNFNGCTVEVWEWISNFTPHFIIDVITYPCSGIKMKQCGELSLSPLNHLRVVSYEKFMKSILDTSLKITKLRIQLHIPGTNGLILQYRKLLTHNTRYNPQRVNGHPIADLKLINWRWGDTNKKIYTKLIIEPVLDILSSVSHSSAEWGLLKLRLLIFPLGKFPGLAKVSVSYFESHLYLTCITANNLSNMSVTSNR